MYHILRIKLILMYLNKKKKKGFYKNWNVYSYCTADTYKIQISDSKTNIVNKHLKKNQFDLNVRLMKI